MPYRIQILLLCLSFKIMATQEAEIEMSQQVGTEILQPDMPSNIDFDSKQPPADSGPRLAPIEQEGLTIKSYSVKGKSIFSLPPQYPLDSIAPLDVHTLPVRCLSKEQLSGGLRGLWESLVGYASREMAIDQGFIYVFARQKEGLRCIALWRLVDLFKVFVDLEDFQLRLVVKTEGSTQLSTRDFQSDQLKNILARLNEQMSSIGLSLT